MVYRLLTYVIGVSVSKNGKKGCAQGKSHTLAVMARRYACDGGSGADTTIVPAR
jgi:hypothetical protein